jgi:hypothetical protein
MTRKPLSTRALVLWGAAIEAAVLVPLLFYLACRR